MQAIFLRGINCMILHFLQGTTVNIILYFINTYILFYSLFDSIIYYSKLSTQIILRFTLSWDEMERP